LKTSLISLFLVVPLLLLPATVGGAVFDPDDDGDIDLIDYQGFVGCFGGPAYPVSDPCAEFFDENGDSYVDLYDFLGFQLVFGQECREDSHCDDGNPCTINTCVDHKCQTSFAPDTTECRASAGDCDAVEYCTGTSADCPEDEFLPGGTECRADAGDCDVPEYCTGSSADCPVDLFEPEGTPCPDELFCNGEETCDASGWCQPGEYPCTDPDFPYCDEAEDECIAQPIVTTKTQLAGNSLGKYPFFEYVKAFNEDATVEVGIDPTRFPEIVGQTCDIYVVEAKTGGQWVGDPSLVDVTTDGAQTEAFGGTTVQENTFTVVGPYELDSAVYDELTGDYTGLGAAYDVVLDCNQNALLDGGDYIDGYGREAGLYLVYDTSAQGPLAVTESATYSVGPVFGIPTNKVMEEVYYPTNIESMGELPLVIVSRGNGHVYTWYDHIGFHMASYGYIVMSHDNNTEPGVLSASLTTLGHTDAFLDQLDTCLLYTSPSPRDRTRSRMPSSA